MSNLHWKTRFPCNAPFKCNLSLLRIKSRNHALKRQKDTTAMTYYYSSAFPTPIIKVYDYEEMVARRMVIEQTRMSDLDVEGFRNEVMGSANVESLGWSSATNRHRANERRRGCPSVG